MIGSVEWWRAWTVGAALVLSGGLAACGGEPEAEPEDAPVETPAAQAPADSAAGAGGATAALADAEGRPVGTARFSQDPAGAVSVQIEVAGLTPGAHGVHVHTIGQCAARNDTAFAAAGGHLNPDGKQHGLENPQGPHAGDLPNLDVGADGSGTAQLTLSAASLSGGMGALLDADGAALIVHAQPDDQRTDPSGNSGPRVACGVIGG